MKISFSRACNGNTVPVHVYALQVESNDSIFFSKKIPTVFSPQDTIKLDSLSNGIYKIKYNDIFGKSRIKEVKLNGNQRSQINIVLDSIDISNFLSKTPIKNLKDGESYSIEWHGGDIAAMYGCYKVNKSEGKIHLKTINLDELILDKEEINALTRYEAELLAIQSLNAKSSLMSFTYIINTNGKLIEIVDDTRNWAGWQCTIGRILRDRFE